MNSVSSEAERLERAARALVGRAGRGRIALGAFRERLPELARQLDADAVSALPDYWGYSRNVDDNAGGIIVHPKLLTAIGALARRRVRVGRHVYHAGLMHSYGYLLSWLETPYGYKRERWLRPTVERGLGLPARTLRSRPDDGTLLQNLSYFVGRVVLRGRPRRLALLERDAAGACAALRGYDYTALSVRRIVERVRVPRRDGNGARRVTLLTDLIDLPGRKKSAGADALLLYAVDDPDFGGARFITCFPLAASARDELLVPERFGRRRPIVPRYNAYVDGFPASPLIGSRARSELDAEQI